MTDTTTLAPCQFCGEHAVSIVYDLLTFYVQCETCGTSGGPSSYRNGAVSGWNRRAPAPASDALEKAVRKLHAAKGRYHNQIAACDLFDLLGLPNFRPGQEPAPPAQEARVPIDPKVVGDLWLKSQGVCLTFCRLLEAEHGITAAQKETPCAPTPSL